MNAEVKARIDRELALLSYRTQLIANPEAVIYYGLPSGMAGVAQTDVLVLVPPGYAGSAIDYAFLPSDSPLRGVVKGQPENVIVEADGRHWARVSYHPHGNGGGPPWDATKHGFHTYVDELLTWLARR